WKGCEDRSDHRGFLAQEVRQASEVAGTPRKFSAVVDRGVALGLREREFLGPVVKALRELAAKVQGLEAKS
ncbi:MAG: hypothetical protein ACI841_000521, partial [Planctomycetota bacterium]